MKKNTLGDEAHGHAGQSATEYWLERKRGADEALQVAHDPSTAAGRRSQ